MARKQSAMKAHRVSEKKRIRNRNVVTAVRTYVKKARTQLATTVAEEAATAVAEAARELDKAANKGIIHRRQAARRKSRLMSKLAVLVRAPAAEEAPAPTTRARRARATTTAAKTTGKTTAAKKPAAPRTSRARTPKDAAS